MQGIAMLFQRLYLIFIAIRNKLFCVFPTESPSQSPSFTPSITPTARPSFTPTARPSYTPTERPTINHNLQSSSKIKIGVYYYPWHGPDFHGRKYLREYLVPRQYPELGEYDDREDEVLSQHIAWSQQAHISVWICSWWGDDRRSDVIMREYMLPYFHSRSMSGNANEIPSFAIHYETRGRTDSFTDFSRVGPDIKYIATHYFNHTNYYKIDNRPVIVVYLTRVMSRDEDGNVIIDFISTMRSAAFEAGYELYIIGDEVFGKAPKTLRSSLALFDAITCYDTYGSMGIIENGYAGQETVDNFFIEQKKWRQWAHLSNTSFIPAVTPGFNDKGVRNNHKALSRKLTKEAEYGTLFSALVTQAKNLTDDASEGLMFVTSFNEWHEDTQIEPVKFAEPTNEDISGNDQNFTEGLSYEGYGTLYLDILRNTVLMVNGENDTKSIFYP